MAEVNKPDKTATEEEVAADTVAAKARPTKFVGRRRAERAQQGGAEEASGTAVRAAEVARRPRVRRAVNAIPKEILEDMALNTAIANLPPNYNFEVHKTIWRIKEANSTRVAIQFPEGLHIYAVTISDILEQFANCETVILGDVTYGACCVDDFTARSLECDFLVHYGHSCLVPTDVTSIPTLYIFVTIAFDHQHLVDTILLNFEAEAAALRLAILGTIQFASSFPAVKAALQPHFASLHIPQAKPLSPGETLGCTSPKLSEVDVLVFVCDGRFHLESVLISNPTVPAYKYDPYNKAFTIETYDHPQMHSLRKAAISTAQSARHYGIILGALGRQGAPHLLLRLQALLRERGIAYITVLLSEIFPQKLELFDSVDAWIQIACPRLSVDWGYAFKKPLLSPYEAEVALHSAQWREIYPMDFYSANGETWGARKGPAPKLHKP